MTTTTNRHNSTLAVHITAPSLIYLCQAIHIIRRSEELLGNRATGMRLHLLTAVIAPFLYKRVGVILKHITRQQDPTNMKSIIIAVVVSCMCGTALSQLARVRATNVGDNSGTYIANQQYPPTPFQYAYSSEDIEGTHSATQSGDGSGRIEGSYTMTLADGRTRTVTYVADENGYRAEVTTNELGTESKNPADVIINSSAITGEQAAIQYGPAAPQRQVVPGPGIGAVQIRQPNSQVALPSYGTFAGVQG